MNPATEQNINEAIDWLQRTGSAVQDFAAEQAPLYCKEVVAWQLWGGVSVVVAGLLSVAAAVFFGRYALKHNDEFSYAAGPISAVAAALGLVCLVGGVRASVQAAVAPRLVIVEHLRGLQNP